jgi:hypothetical protein
MEDVSSADLMYLINSARPEIKIEFAQLVELIENGQVSIAQYRYNIREVIESYIVYGANIHSWK